MFKIPVYLYTHTHTHTHTYCNLHGGDTVIIFMDIFWKTGIPI